MSGEQAVTNQLYSFIVNLLAIHVRLTGTDIQNCEAANCKYDSFTGRFGSLANIAIGRKKVTLGAIHFIISIHSSILNATQHAS